MKTADSIEAQEERKQARDNSSQPDSSRANKPPAGQKARQRDASRIAAWKFQPGQSGNPSGRPKHDLAAELAKAIFEENWPELYQAYLKAALKGNGYIFEVLANRGFGKLKETHQVDISPYKDMPTEDLERQIKQLEENLGYRKPEVPSEPAVLPPADESSNSKPN